jgi:citrate lyase subunit beta / citryl-CoA lyase
MKLRSLLFVPADRPERFQKAIDSGADAIILDFEDSVAAERKAAARDAIAAFLTNPRACAVLVRINPLDTDMADADLAAILPGKPDGIVLPKAEGASALNILFDKMASSDAPVLPIATETPAAMFELGTYASVAHRLLGLTWGAEDLPAAIGASTARESDGRYTAPIEMARSLTLFGAHKAGIPAIETVYPDFKDEAGLAAYAARGRRDGFSGMMAIHPCQIPIINTAFTPSAAEVAHATEVIKAFEANPGAGVLQLNGKMIDAPHLKQARNIILMAAP